MNSQTDMTFGSALKQTFKSQIILSNVFTKGHLIYGTEQVWRKSAVLYYVKLALLGLVFAGQVNIWLETRNIFNAGISIFAFLCAAYIWQARKITHKRIIESEEFLSMWFIRNLPNERINSQALLEKGFIADKENNRAYLLILGKNKSELCIYDFYSRDIMETEPTAVYTIEKH